MPATAGSKPADDTDDKGWRHLGSAAVHIGENGIIDAGCPGLEGEHVDHLDENRDERADRQEQAEQAGWKSQDHQSAEAAHAAIKPSTPEGSIALVRVGGKYHTFGDDAQHMQRVLGMGDGQHAEFDHEHLEDHLKNLVKNGHRVAIVERKEDEPPEHKAQVGPEHAEAIDDKEDHEDSEPGRLPDMEKEGGQEGEQPAAAKEPWQQTRAELGQHWGEAPANSLTPWQGKTPAAGTWRMDPRTGELEQLQAMDPRNLQFTEDPADVANSETYKQYEQWARQGIQPPPITAAMHADGDRIVSNNRRRLMAALATNQPSINAWYTANGARPETHKTAIEKALADGKQVPPEVLAEYPELQQAAAQPQPAAQQYPEPSRTYTTAMGKKSSVNNTLRDPSLFGDASDIEIALGAVSPEQQEDLAQDIKKVRPDLANAVDDAMWGVMSWRQKMLPDEQPQQQVDQRHASLAAIQQQLQHAPPKMRHAIEAMHQLADVQRDGTGSTKRLSPGYAQSLHDHLTSMPGHSDGFGQVYDLSDHLGPGAVGYHSPAGVLAMVPPQWQGQPWEARYSAETQGGTEQPDDSTTLAEQQPEPSPYVTPAPEPERDLFDDALGYDDMSDSYEPAANDEATTQHLAELTKDHKGLASAVKEAFPDNVELQAAAADMALQEWQQHADFNEEFKRQRRYLLNAMGGKDWGLKAARLKQAAERGDDTASAIKGFDTMAQAYQHEAPLMFTPLKWDSRRGRYVESGGSGERGQSLDSDATAALLDNLAKPEREFETPPPEDHRFLGAALDELDQWKDAVREPDESEQEALPFSRRRQAAQLAGAV